ncbi:unnamed protein product [Bursaphelenchus xylophilus]|uniref:(pine wood nematode) hypothetical protein n=1 Tax=Bursaphelenchus xylophilus TaxID=6326 RepID=A0A1I7SUC1_BURXY|nr:unnamed protein product [Bursaphelenchus xylophilus]CAG9107309.1 unnamed protein product [Bursaphelenchus xylophilus]
MDLARSPFSLSCGFLIFSAIDSILFKFAISTTVFALFLSREQAIQFCALLGFCELLNFLSLIYYWICGESVFAAFQKSTDTKTKNVLESLNQSKLNRTFNKSFNSSSLCDFRFRVVDDNGNTSIDKANWSQIFSDSSSGINYSKDSSLNQSPRSFPIQSTGPNSLELSSFSSPHHSVYTEGQYERLRFKKDSELDSSLNDSSFVRKIDFVFTSGRSSFGELNSTGYQLGYHKGEERKLDDMLLNMYQKAETEVDEVPSSGNEPNSTNLKPSLKRRDSVSKEESSSSFQKNAEKLREASSSFSSNYSLNQLFSGDKTKKSPHKENPFALSVVHKLNIHDQELLGLTKFSLKFRFFMHESVIKPFIDGVDEANKSLKKFNLNIAVGTTKLEDLQFHLDQRPELYGTQLPFLLPFLKIHSNQHYLVKRLRDLNKSSILHGYQYDKVGEQNTDDSSSVDDKWSTEFPTDAEILFGIFCLYMDHCIVPESLARIPTRPFSSLYVYKEPSQLAFTQKLPTAFYIRQKHQQPAFLFEFVCNGGADIYSPPAGPHNMFAAIYLFLNHCAKNNGGYLGDMRIDRKGLNLAHLLADD